MVLDHINGNSEWLLVIQFYVCEVDGGGGDCGG